MHWLYHILAQPWVRVWAAFFYGLGMLILAGLGNSFLRDKDLGHKSWIRFGTVFAFTRGIAAEVVAWDVYHRQTTTISPTSVVASALTLSFAAYTVWVSDDLRRTFWSSEKAERERQRVRVNYEQDRMNTTFLTFEAEKKTKRLLEQVINERQR